MEKWTAQSEDTEIVGGVTKGSEDAWAFPSFDAYMRSKGFHESTFEEFLEDNIDYEPLARLDKRKVRILCQQSYQIGASDAYQKVLDILGNQSVIYHTLIKDIENLMKETAS